MSDSTMTRGYGPLGLQTDPTYFYGTYEMPNWASGYPYTTGLDQGLAYLSWFSGLFDGGDGMSLPLCTFILL
jgi:hypothetical protein